MYPSVYIVLYKRKKKRTRQIGRIFTAIIAIGPSSFSAFPVEFTVWIMCEIATAIVGNDLENRCFEYVYLSGDSHVE